MTPDVAGNLRVPTDHVTPPGVAAVLPPAECKSRIELHRNPACFVSPVLKKRCAGLQQFLSQVRVEPLQSREKNNGVATCAGDRDGIELQVAKASDDLYGGPLSPLTAAPGWAGESSPGGFEQAGPCQCQTASLADTQRFHRPIIPRWVSPSPPLSDHCFQGAI